MSSTTPTSEPRMMLLHAPIKRHPDQADIDSGPDGHAEANGGLPHKRVHLDPSTAKHEHHRLRQYQHQQHRGRASGGVGASASERRMRSHSSSMPFHAFSKMHITPSNPPTAALVQPTPVRPEPAAHALIKGKGKAPSSYDVSPHRTIVTSLEDDDDDDERDGLAPSTHNTTPQPRFAQLYQDEGKNDAERRSASPPISAHFHLNPALAAQLAAQHPFGGGGGLTSSDGTAASDAWARSFNAHLSALAPATSQSGDASNGALVLYKPVKPKPAFVRPEDEEREDEHDDEQAGEENKSAHQAGNQDSSSLMEVNLDDARTSPIIEEVDEDNELANGYFARSKTRRSSRSHARRPQLSSLNSRSSHGSTSTSTSTSTSNGLRIIELEDGEDAGEGFGDGGEGGDEGDFVPVRRHGEQEMSTIYPTYIETPDSPPSASASALRCASSASTLGSSFSTTSSASTGASFPSSNGVGMGYAHNQAYGNVPPGGVIDLSDGGAYLQHQPNATQAMGPAPSATFHPTPSSSTEHTSSIPAPPHPSFAFASNPAMAHLSGPSSTPTTTTMTPTTTPTPMSLSASLSASTTGSSTPMASVSTLMSSREGDGDGDGEAPMDLD